MKEQKDYEKLPLQPPEIQYISTRRVIKIPVTDPHFSGSPWELRVYAAKLVEQEIGDEVEVTALQVKQPSAATKRVARLFNRVPNARLYLTIKF
jgi:hypothetical protein